MSRVGATSDSLPPMEEPPNSLETRMLREQLQAKQTYPFLRATRRLIRFGVLGYAVVGVVLTLSLLGGKVAKDDDVREVVVAWGGPEKGAGVFAAFILLAVVALRSVLLLAVSEAIQLLLEMRATQLETSKPNS